MNKDMVNNSFIDGMMLTIQFLIIDVDQPTYAIEIMRNFGLFTRWDFIKAQRRSQYESRRVNKVIREAFPDQKDTL